MPLLQKENPFLSIDYKTPNVLASTTPCGILE